MVDIENEFDRLTKHLNDALDHERLAAANTVNLIWKMFIARYETAENFIEQSE